MAEIRKVIIYRIFVNDRLDPEWTAWFEDFTITSPDGKTTVLTGPVADQSALHGVLARIRDLGLTLLSVQTTAQGDKRDE